MSSLRSSLGRRSTTKHTTKCTDQEAGSHQEHALHPSLRPLDIIQQATELSRAALNQLQDGIPALALKAAHPPADPQQGLTLS